MASPATGDADAAERFFEDVTNFTRFGSDVVNNDGHSSIPPSPELGMAREGGGYISDAEWSLSEKDGAESQQHGGPARSIETHGHDSASKADNGDARVKGSLVRRTQRTLPESAQRASPEHMDAQRTTPAPTCPPIRRSTRIKSTLVYDQKYHPLDDIIRPSQAAKRRSLHGEESTRPNYSDGSASEDSGFDVGSGDENSGDEEPRPSTRGHKRRRLMSQAPEPTRRSSRRRTKPNVSYNMKIHPQDSDLRRVGACDGSKSSPSPTKHRRSSRNSPAEKDRSASGFEDACHPMVVGGSSESTLQPSPELSPSRGSTPEPPAKPTQQLFDEQPELRPDVAYLTTNQHAWPDVNGLPFHIFTERIQDQLNKEAEAASPFHYDDDDKENDVTNPELVPAPNSLDGISIIPASQHRHALELHTYQGYNTIANNAFHMQPRLEALPYGLGWSDGVHNVHISDNRNHPMPDYMRILTSGENLPQTPTPADTCSDSHEPAANSSPTRTLEGLELLR